MKKSKAKQFKRGQRVTLSIVDDNYQGGQLVPATVLAITKTHFIFQLDLDLDGQPGKILTAPIAEGEIINH